MPFKFSRLSPLPLVCAAALTAGAGPALAQSASASVGTAGFSYQLIDLDPTDNIAPAISFNERLESTSWYDNGTGVVDYDQIQTFGTTSIARAFGAASTSSTATTSRAQAGFELASPYFQLFSSQHFHGWDFEITPSTGILFRANATLSATHAGDGTRSLARASMVGYLNHFGDESLEQSDFTDMVSIENGARAYTLSGYLHSGQESLRGAFGIGTEATAAFYGISPVPEPSTYAMLLAGLGLLGWRARSRTKS